jgi:hypothetical protein
MEQEKLIYQLLKLIFAPVDGANFSVDIHSFFVVPTIFLWISTVFLWMDHKKIGRKTR